MAHTDLSQNDELPSRDDHSEPGTPATSTSHGQATSSSSDQSATQPAHGQATITNPGQSATQPGHGPAPAQTAGANDPASRPEPASTPPEHAAAAQPATAQRAAGQSSPDGQPPRAQLLGPEELRAIAARWRDIQAGFVDEPRRAVMDADALVADLMQRLARMFAAEREELQSRWMGGHDTSTEDLRQDLRHYRLFFERLLAV
jgi:hypothetical protein